MSGVGTDAGSSRKRLIASGLRVELGQRRRGINAEENLPVQKAVFVTNHQARCRIIVEDQQPQTASGLGDIENEIGGEGFARAQCLIQRSLRITKRSTPALPFSANPPGA